MSDLLAQLRYINDVLGVMLHFYSRIIHGLEIQRGCAAAQLRPGSAHLQAHGAGDPVRAPDPDWPGHRLYRASAVGTRHRARITQIMNLTLLAPDIQEELLMLPRIERGRAAIRLRVLQPIAIFANWKTQRDAWKNRRDRDVSRSAGFQNSPNRRRAELN